MSIIPTPRELHRHIVEQRIIRESKAAFFWSWVFCVVAPLLLCALIRIDWLHWLISAVALWKIAITCERKMSSLVDQALLFDQCSRELDALPSCRKYFDNKLESARSRAGYWYCFGEPCAIMKYVYALVAIAAIYSELIR